MEKSKCELCGTSEKLTRHHLIPQVRAKNKYKAIKEDNSNIAILCETCHRTIHALFTENELRDNLNSISLLKNNKEINNYLKWRLKHLTSDVSPAKLSKRLK